MREIVQARAMNRCERCGVATSLRWSIHHRRPRGMGGSKKASTNSPANLLLLCGSGTEGCHGWVESNRAEARSLGLLLYQTDEPTEVPVHTIHGKVVLDDAGGWQPVRVR